jgi:glycosyltransferase involved in cell wall biosynthesis
MRVLVDGIVYGRQTYGGINTYFNQVLPRIARRPETDVDIFLPPACRGIAPGPPVRRRSRDLLPARTGLSWRLDERLQPVIERVNRRLMGMWAKTKRDVVFQSTYFTSLPVRVPHVAIAHDLNHELFPHLYDGPFGRWLRQRYPEYLREADRIIAVSHTTKAHVCKFYGIDPERVDVVHHATDHSTFFPETSDRTLARLWDEFRIRPPYILYVGVHASPFKNFGTLLEAFRRCAREQPHTLVVAGPPWNQEEEERISHLPAYASVRIVRYPDDALLRALYGFATAFVYPSLFEGFGIPLLEAMACGTPIVASDIPPFREVAGDAVLYFDPSDPDDMANAIRRCFKESSSQEYRARGLQRAGAYSWDRSASDTYAVYKKALGRR